ncbi:MAG TPA: hypothetical protein VIF09_09510 [Polyangiaceae bacterium]|jgi:hypothetical protein
MSKGKNGDGGKPGGAAVMGVVKNPVFRDEQTYGLWSELAQLTLGCLRQAGHSTR